MDLKTFLSKINKTWEHGGFIGVVTEDNLSQSLKFLLEYCPRLFENELPKIYKNTYVIVDYEDIDE